MRDLKRKHPLLYKHVLISNGAFHSSAHFQFAICTLWDKTLLHVCMSRLNKSDLVRPNIKNLEHNSYLHTRDVCGFRFAAFAHGPAPRTH